jgi:hypothetical protein
LRDLKNLFFLCRFDFKSNSRKAKYENFNMVSLFNHWINRWGMIYIKYPTRSFSWYNNQERAIMKTLDGILMSVDWEAKYPLDQSEYAPQWS